MISRPKKIGVIGLGNMGRGIARNLIEAGNDVYAWDTDEAARKPFLRTATFFIRTVVSMVTRARAYQCHRRLSPIQQLP